MNYNRKQLQQAVKTGDYPSGVKAADLAQSKISQAYSLLHQAAQLGHLPPRTTAEDLSTTQSDEGITPLHEAAYCGYLPPDTTIQILSQTKDNEGLSALYYAYNGFEQKQPILKKATLFDLINDVDNQGVSVLQHITSRSLPNTIKEFPNRRIVLAHLTIKELLNKDHTGNPKQIKAIADLTNKVCPIETALWVAKQIEKHHAK